MIPFNKPYLTGNETKYIEQAVQSGKISGNGDFTKKCQNFFEQRYAFTKTLLTTSCTDALEMSAILSDIKPGDEVIVPSYTFVSTALAFVRQGAKIIFADSRSDHPCMDTDHIEHLITKASRAIVPVHYAGVACDMDKVMDLAGKYNLVVIEDAAQAIDSQYKGRQLGGIGHLSSFSFHETKNINSGEGGLLAINDEQYLKRAEIIWEKGTNRAEFFRGEVNKYGWVDIGSSFLPSEIIAAYLWAQLECIDRIQQKRVALWNRYYDGLIDWAPEQGIMLPFIPDYATNNGHMFYLVCNNHEQQQRLINKLKRQGILAVFHYLSLHKSDYYKDKYTGESLQNADWYSDCLIRLPLYYELKNEEVDFIISVIKSEE
ncbi:MAG TPA: dTDP-4-amino-4,6-dideoxygalactose transaminase [Bacteroidales bacterium]|nr:dTDP-4-amino-4,6-dideoxygalactose transaminase [Bacteroidales bacterium]